MVGFLSVTVEGNEKDAVAGQDAGTGAGAVFGFVAGAGLGVASVVARLARLNSAVWVGIMVRILVRRGRE
jgi:hypothetical protein